jgi:hypothetical protein
VRVVAFIAAMPRWALVPWAIALVVLVANVATMRRLWASQIYERSQKTAQTVLVWVAPGTVFLVRHLLAERQGGRSVDPLDPTAGGASHGYDEVGGVGHHCWNSGGGGFGDGGGGDGSVGPG